MIFNGLSLSFPPVISQKLMGQLHSVPQLNPFPVSIARHVEDVISIYYRELVFMKIVHIITMRRKIMSESLILRLIKKIRLSKICKHG